MEEVKKQSSQMKYQTNRYLIDPEFRANLKEQVKQNYLKRYNSEDPIIRDATRDRKREINKASYLRAKAKNEENRLKVLEYEKLKKELNIL
jgi:hypothetical protein